MKFAGFFTGGIVTGIIRPGKAFVPVAPAINPVSLSTASNVTYTIAQLMRWIIVRDPNGADRTDVLPTAALIVAGIPGLKLNDYIQFKLINGADAAESVILTAGTGGAFDANQAAGSAVVSQNQSKFIQIRMTGISTPAYVAYV